MSNTITQQRLNAVLQSVNDEARLVAVSKYHPAERIQECYDVGQRVFGESHEQELRIKVPALPDDIEWHFIGHLQTNKVKYITPYIYMIETVDSLKLLREIEKQAAKHDRTIRVLLEVHVAKEESKYGLTPDECREMLQQGEWRTMSHIKICGLMTMATNTNDEVQIRQDFNTAYNLFCELKQEYFADSDDFCERSWGMSGDYPIAIECNSTLVRIGTSIFGERQY